MKAVWAKISNMDGNYRMSPKLILGESGTLVNDSEKVANMRTKPFTTVEGGGGRMCVGMSHASGTTTRLRAGR